MRRNPVLLLSALLIFIPLLAEAGIDKAGTTAANFLSVGAGPDVLAMGGATLGFGSSLSAASWNAAALGDLRSTEYVFSHASLSGLSPQEWIAAGGRFGLAPTRWGFTGLYQGDGSFDGRDALNNPTGTFTASSMALGVELAQPLGHFASVGVGTKYVSEKLGDLTGGGLTFDFGLRMKAGPLGFGAAAQNAFGKMSYNGLLYDFPTNYGLGVAYSLPLTGLTFALDGNFPTSYYSDVRGGVEWRWHDRLALRTGYRKELNAAPGEPLGGPTFGMGAGANGFWFDYGYVTGGDAGNGQHRFGLTFHPGFMNGEVAESAPKAVSAPVTASAPKAVAAPPAQAALKSQPAPKKKSSTPYADALRAETEAAKNGGTSPAAVAAPVSTAKSEASTLKPATPVAPSSSSGPAAPTAAATAAPMAAATATSAAPAAPTAAATATAPTSGAAPATPAAPGVATTSPGMTATSSSNATNGSAAAPAPHSRVAPGRAASATRVSKPGSAKSAIQAPAPTKSSVLAAGVSAAGTSSAARSIATPTQAASAAPSPAAASPTSSSVAPSPANAASAPSATTTAANVTAAPAPSAGPAPAAVAPAPAAAAPTAAAKPEASAAPASPAPASAPAMAPRPASPAKTKDETSEAAPKGPRPKQVKVKGNETLADIAKRWNTSPAAIMMLNDMTSDRVKGGQTLKLPPASN